MIQSDPTLCPSCAAPNPADGAICSNCGGSLTAFADNEDIAELVGELTGALEGKYVIGRTLGSGRGGVVVEATHIASRRTVALKVAWPIDSARQQVLRETILSSKVRHPNVVQMRDVAAPESLLVVEMPLLTGGSLAQVISNYGPVPFQNVLAILRSIGGALDEAHAAGIIHGGLHPSKILMSRDERAFVSDFAIRVPQQADWDLARPSEAGSLAYMPLEQRHDSPNMDGRIDQYALAIIAYELLRGHPTWRYSVDGGVQIDPIEVIVHRPIVNDAPLSAGSAIKRAISKDPAFRFVSAGEFVRSFSGVAEERVVPAEQTYHEEKRVERRRVSPAMFLIPLALGVLAAAAVPQIRDAAIGTIASLLPSRDGGDAQGFQIDTSAAIASDSTQPSKNAKKKAAPDSGKRRRGASGDVTTIPEFEESVLVIRVDGGEPATVLVDGRARGQAPVTVKVPAGQHQVSVRGPQRFSPSSVTIIVASGDTARARFKAETP